MKVKFKGKTFKSYQDILDKLYKDKPITLLTMGESNSKLKKGITEPLEAITFPYLTTENKGLFSLLATRAGHSVLSIDNDISAIDHLYNFKKKYNLIRSCTLTTCHPM